MGSVGDESHAAAVAEAVKEVPEEPDLEGTEVTEDAAVEAIEEVESPEVEVREDAAVEVIEEVESPEVEVREDAAVEAIEKVEIREDAAVEVIEEVESSEVEVREDAAVEAIEEVESPEVEVREDAAVEVIEEVESSEVEVCEDAAVEVLEEKFSAVMGAGIDDNLLVSMGEEGGEGNGDVGVEEVVPQPRRKLPSVKRFSARRSAGLDDGNTMDYGSVRNGDAVPDSTAPSAIRRQRGAYRFSARRGMGVDDRDTVDYGLVKTDDPPKPVESDAVVEEAAPSTTRKPVLSVAGKTVLSVAEREQLRLQNIRRNKEIVCWEWERGRRVNVTAGLELHTGVFSRVEQQKLVDLCREFKEKGRRGELMERTYMAPLKWMPGKGRITLQFGCCYNYSVDRDGSPPGISREDIVDPIPPLLRTSIKRLVRWHVLPPTCVPDSCIINMYEEGDCIPPHIDHHDFLRPFCTLSLVSECNIELGKKLRRIGDGKFVGTLSLPLPVGSVLVLNGNGADVAMHCIPSVPAERISITFRKMDPAKVPKGFVIDKELQNLRPVMLPSDS